MHSLNQVNKLVSCGRDPARSLPLWRGFLLIPLILVCFAFAPQTRAVSPPPDGGYPGFNTAEGQQALQFETSGIANTGLGWRALYSVDGSSYNTGVGAGALVGAGATLVGVPSIAVTSLPLHDARAAAALKTITNRPIAVRFILHLPGTTSAFSNGCL